ncbi:hypothetical protein HGRIS_008075 [Hohenbuehelia grisea]|uniref:F-box domain-containing protein n=1 Tax=Hohenbuehelia grisea TaxID=104357 RepID=A0ABR3J791_9AGAR
MIELPTEIWLKIASYIPDQEMARLCSLNRVFMNLALEKRYGVVDLSFMSERALRLIDHLKNDSIADRVRTLRLSSQFVQGLILNEKSDLQYSRSIRGRLSSFKSRLLPGKKPPKPRRPSYFGSQPRKSSNQIIADIDEVLCKLRNVKNFTTYWAFFPLDAYPHSRAWSTFGADLEMLRLVGTATLLPSLLQDVEWPERLSDLRIEMLGAPYIDGEPVEDTPAAQMDVLRCVSSFINKQHNLKSLAIEATWHADFSTLFSSLVRFPMLESLTLKLPFNRLHLPDPSGILHFMHEHAEQIKDFTLHFFTCGLPLPSHEEGALNHGFQIFDQSLPNLTSLDLDLRSSCQPLDADALLPKLGTAKLQSLRIEGLLMSYSNLRSLSAGFPVATSLRHLSLKIRTIDKSVFDLLSQSFPRLHSLYLVVAGGLQINTHVCL